MGEPDFGTLEHITAAVFAAVRAGATKYTGKAGRIELREQTAAHVRSRTLANVTAENVVVTVDAIGALFTAPMSILDPGDEVLIPDPGWPNYESIAVLAGARPPPPALRKGRVRIRPRPHRLLDRPAYQAIPGKTGKSD